MTQEQIKAINELKTQGYAVVLFNPDELEGAEADRVEDRLVELGWDVIYDLRPDAEYVREALMALHNAKNSTEGNK